MNAHTSTATETLLQTMVAFRQVCLIGAGAELDVFTALAHKTATAEELAAVGFESADNR